MSNDHPIQGLMQTAMENLRDMVDVNTIIGSPVETPDGQVIIPVSKVGFGFAAGGSEFSNGVKQTKTSNGNGHASTHDDKKFPFGGGSGGGVSITPVAFIVVGDQGIRLLSMEGNSHLIDRIFDLAPNVFGKWSGKRKHGVCGTGDTDSQTHTEEY